MKYSLTITTKNFNLDLTLLRVSWNKIYKKILVYNRWNQKLVITNVRIMEVSFTTGLGVVFNSNLEFPNQLSAHLELIIIIINRFLFF